MNERRNRLRRALCGGLVLGGGAALALGLLEGASGLASAPGAFDTWAERREFVAACALLLVAGGVLGGALLGAVVGAVGLAVERAAPRPRQETWAARVYTGLATPVVALVASQIFKGRRAQLIPGHQWMALGIGLVGLGACYGVARAALAFSRRCTRASRCALVGALLAGAAAAARLADGRVLPRLYPFFHLTLDGATFLLATAAAFSLHLAAHRRGWRVGRLPEPALALALALLTVAGGAFVLRRLGRSETLRATVYQHTALCARLLEGARAAGVARGAAPPAPPRHVAASETAPLPVGPVFPDGDVVLITVDALRADRLQPRTAPHLAALAATGAQFDHACAQVPHTSFSLTTLLTGKYAYSLAALGVDPASHETLADVFQRYRYKTAAFFPPSVFFIDEERFANLKKSLFHFEYAKFEYLDAHGRTQQVIDFLESEHPARAFVWVHYFEPHEPYDVHEGHTAPGASTALERYDGEVHYVDAEIARLIDWLRANRPRAILALAADHGEEFGEHGGRYHGTTLYEEQVHVPLFFVTWGYSPGLAARHVAAPVGLVDVAPTLLGLAGITPSAKMRGHDLGPYLAPAGCPVERCAARLGPTFAEIDARKLLADGDDRLICDMGRGFCELYDVGADPGEQRNLVTRRGDRATALEGQLEAWLADQSAFEKPLVAADEGARRLLERGRLGDGGAGPGISDLLLSPDAAVAREAEAALLALPPNPLTGDGIDRARAAHPDDPVLRVLALRLGERTLGPPLATWAAGGDVDPRARVEVALALSPHEPKLAVPLLLRSLDDPLPEEREKRVIAALGESGDRRAAAALVAHLDGVRTRLDVVRALGVLKMPGTAGPLLARLADEPYVTVRAEMARVLGALGDRRAQRPLERLLAVEKEPLVAAAVTAALAELRGRGR